MRIKRCVTEVNYIGNYRRFLLCTVVECLEWKILFTLLSVLRKHSMFHGSTVPASLPTCYKINPATDW